MPDPADNDIEGAVSEPIDESVGPTAIMARDLAQLLRLARCGTLSDLEDILGNRANTDVFLRETDYEGNPNEANIVDPPRRAHGTVSYP